MDYMKHLDHFDVIAPIYDKLIRTPQKWNLMKLANLPANGLLLDVGGGTGRVSEALEKCASKVIVTDLSFEMLIRARVNKGLLAVCAQAEKMPFPDDSFDRIIMVDALHHVYSQKNSASELWRLIKPNGRIIIEEPNIEKLSVKIVALLEKLAFMRSHFLSPAEIAQLFKFPKAQIEIVKEGYNSWVLIDKIL
jgi:demethylmenaquinone methyltransferase/2-methoxy-6-polyprenyl-1,4-benzoquinol methylase